MLYILLILLISMMFINRHIINKNTSLKEFNISETTPLRGLLSVCVMLTHICPYFINEAPLLKDFCLWGPPSVGTFFLLTGYGLGYSYKIKGERYLNGFFKKRLLKLLWPLIFMTIVFQSYKIYHNSFDFVELINSPSPMSWFIYALVIWYIGYYFSFKVSKKHKIQLGLIWCFTIVYLLVTVYLKLYYFYISILPLPIAITYAFYEDKIKTIITNHTKVVWWIVLIITIIVMGYAIAGQYNAKLAGWGMPVYTLVPCVIVYITYYLGGLKNNFTNFLGKISYEFYIVHGFIVILLGNYSFFGMTGYVNAIAVITLVFGLTVLTAWLLFKLCNNIK